MKSVILLLKVRIRRSVFNGLMAKYVIKCMSVPHLQAWGILSMVRVFLKVGQIQAAMQWLESHQEMLGKSLEGSDNFNDVTFLCILSNAKYKCGDLGSSFDIIIAVLKVSGLLVVNDEQDCR